MTGPPAPIGRRGFLRLAGAAATAAVVAGCAGRPGGAGRGDRGAVTFTNALPIPPLDPGSGSAGRRGYALRMVQGSSEFVPGKPARTYGFNQPYLGPTLLMRRGETVAVDVRNQLPEPSTVHWHGMRLPARMDGGPHQVIEPGGRWQPAWQVDQPAATLWYHPHPHGETAKHVYRGLAGLIIVADREPSGLPDRYGVNDIPLVLQDRVIGPDGSLREDRPGGIWGLMGQEILVNGVRGAVHTVTESPTRFRVLNGSNARTYHLRFGDGRTFAVVGTDVGLLPAPVDVTEVALSPGERVEIVVAFSRGEQSLLQSRGGTEDVDDGDFDILSLQASPTLAAGAPVPASIRGAPSPVIAPPGARVRRFQLSGDKKINAKEMDLARVDEVVPRGAVEIWEIDNIVFAHNFHIHDAAFTVLSIDGKPPPDYQTGRKDTVFVPGYTVVRVAVAFGDHADPGVPYMYHCHMLRHEDVGMMGQFTIVEPGTENTAPRQLAIAHSGHH